MSMVQRTHLALFLFPLTRFVSYPVDYFRKKKEKKRKKKKMDQLNFQNTLLMPRDINKDRITKQVIPLCSLFFNISELLCRQLP